jgi:Fungal N-terminal domain of STAND proteins
MDPVSLAASITGLILFVKEVKELSEKIYDTVRSKPHHVRKIADDLAALEIVLERLEQYTHDDGKKGEQEALSNIISACKKAISETFKALSALRDGFSQGILSRVFSYSKFKRQMEKLSELRTELAAFKLTLGLVLQVRTM